MNYVRTEYICFDFKYNMFSSSVELAMLYVNVAFDVRNHSEHQACSFHFYSPLPIWLRRIPFNCTDT